MPKQHKMICSQPETPWQDALPTKSGTTGVMAFARMRNETILLNYERLWPCSAPQQMVGVSEHLAEPR